LNNTAACEESAQPDNNTQQNQAPSEAMNVPYIPEKSSGASRLQAGPVSHQQPVAESHAAPPSVRFIMYCIALLVYLW